MAKYANKKSALIADETTNGVYVAPTGEPTYPINDVEIVAAELNLNEHGRPAIGKYTRGVYMSGKQSASVNYTSFMMQPDDWTTDIEVAPIFEAAGFHAVAGVDLDFELIYDGNSNCQTQSMDVTTQGCYSYGSATAVGDTWKLRGIHNNLTIETEDIGAPIMINVEAMGCIEAKEDSANNVTPPAFLDGAVYDRFLGAAVTLDGSTLEVQNFSFNMGNTISITGDVSQATGGKTSEITDADPKINVSSLVGASTAALWGKTTSNTPVGDLVVYGQVFKYTFSDCTISSYTEADADGILVLNLELSISGDIKIENVL